jgi:hypothetical protein
LKSRILRIFAENNPTSIMIIERTSNEFVIRFPFTADTKRMQDIIDYLRYNELTANSSAPPSEVDAIARKINSKWWKQNAAKFEKQPLE